MKVTHKVAWYVIDTFRRKTFSTSLLKWDETRLKIAYHYESIIFPSNFLKVCSSIVRLLCNKCESLMSVEIKDILIRWRSIFNWVFICFRCFSVNFLWLKFRLENSSILTACKNEATSQIQNPWKYSTKFTRYLQLIKISSISVENSAKKQTSKFQKWSSFSNACCLSIDNFTYFGMKRNA